MIFSTVTAFVESVGRRIIYRFSELDQMRCIYTGPNALADAFLPPVNAPHAVYPLMFVTASEVTKREATIAEVTVTYEGKINGNSPYVTAPITTESSVQGSRDFSRSIILPTSPPVYGTQPNPLNPAAPLIVLTQPALYSVGTQTITVRYIGTQVSIRYHACPRPTGLHYSSLGLSRVHWTVLSQTYGAVSVAASGLTGPQAQSQNFNVTGAAPLFASNLGFERTQRAGKWYDCTEIYGPTF
jgi:hypothetical protein